MMIAHQHGVSCDTARLRITPAPGSRDIAWVCRITPARSWSNHTRTKLVESHPRTGFECQLSHLRRAWPAVWLRSAAVMSSAWRPPRRRRRPAPSAI
eukprot:1831558-Prymnesium_polylepis.1